jgi:hypothetical protein
MSPETYRALGRQEMVLTSLTVLLICGFLSFAAINRAGESQDLSIKSQCESLLALVTIAQDPRYQTELHGVTRGMTPSGVRRLPQCKERLP